MSDQHEDTALSRALFPPQAALPAATVARTIGLRRSPVLDGLDLHVAAGELVAVVGRPGTGKTTLVRALDGLEPVDGGRVDVATRRQTIDDRARLLHWRRVAGNVRVGVPATATLSVDDALEIVGLGHRTKAWPAGLTTEEVARVKLARALRHDPALLLLDGLLDGILPAGRTALARTLRAASRELDLGVLLTTSAADDAVQVADRVLVLDHGRIAAEISVDLGERRSRDTAGYRKVRAAVSSSAFVDLTDSLVRSS